MFDSTFSPLIAQFQDEEPIPYADDEPILPKEEIAKALDSREERYTGLLTTVGYASTDQWWKKVEPALERGDRAFIEKNPWQLSGNFQGLLQGLWNDTWDAGCFHAVKGLNIVNQQAADVSEAGRSPGNFSRAEFADYPLPEYPQEPFYTAYPPNYGYPLRNTDLQSAVEQRVLYLANDVNQKTRDRIQGSVMNAVSQHGAEGIPKRDRAKLLQQINLSLGRQSLDEIKDPDVAIGEKLVRTSLRVPGTQTFRSRAKTIAATEISAAYSLGRLQVYTQAGVKRVRWQTLEDLSVCRVCRSRNGIVIELDMLLAQHQYAYRRKADPTQFVFPAHPNCRCLPVPLDERRKSDKDKIADPGRSPEQRQPSNLSKGWNALKNVIGVTVAIASAAQAVQRGVEDIQQQQLARQQEEERQKQEQARKLARAIMVTGGAALSLGVLYMIMRGQAQRLQQQQQPGIQAAGVVPIQPGGLGSQLIQQASSELNRAQQVEEVRSRPVLPAEILTEPEQQEVLADLPLGLNLRTVNKTSLISIYGLTVAEASLVEKLRKQYERDRITPPEQALVPQFFLPPDLLSQLPELRQAGNLRDLSVRDLARMILRRLGEVEGVERQAQGVQSAIERQVQNVLGLPPARTDSPPGELMVGGVNLNTATVEEIARLLPAGMSLERRRAIAQVIYLTIRRMSALGTPITSLEELAAIPGVGKITVRNMLARNYTQNLNNLLLQVGDKEVAQIIAAILDIGPKLSETIVKEFRANGQFGKPGIDAAEDLIERLQQRVEQEGQLYLSEETKNRIRERLAGRMYIMPIPSTQPIGGIQPQGVSASPSSSPPAQITGGVTPQNPQTTVHPALPPGEAPIKQPLITSPTSLGFPRRAQPITPSNKIIPVSSVEDNQRQRRDNAFNEYSEVLGQVADYQNDITKTVNDARMPKQGILGGGLKLDKYKNQVFNAALRSIEKATNVATGMQINTFALEQMGDLVERNLNDIESRLQNIDDPLADQLFKQNGQLVNEVRDKIQISRSTIRQGLKIISAGLTLPDAMWEELNKRKEELLGLKTRSRSLIDEALNTTLKSQRDQLMQSLDSQIATLTQFIPQQLGGYYGEIQQLIEKLNELKRRVGESVKSDVITSIDGIISAVDDVLQNAQNLKRQELVNYLNEAAIRFNELQKRLNELPRTFDELAPQSQEEFVGAKGVRDRIKGRAMSLDRNVSALQRRIQASQKFLDDTLELYNNATLSEAVYEKEKQLGLEYAQNIINLSVQGIDKELAILRNLADPLKGMASVMSTVTQINALQDKPALPQAPTVPGLAPLPPAASPRDEVKGRFLDEAIAQRREAINRAAARITSNGVLQSGFPYSYVQRIELVINPDAESNTPLPEVVARSHLSSVDQLLKLTTKERELASTEIQELANAVADDMEQLRQLDPVTYTELLLRSPTWADVRRIKAGVATQVEEYDRRLLKLQNIRAILIADSYQLSAFEYRGVTLSAAQLRDRMNEIKQQVGQLIAKRRDDLTSIWNKLAPLTTADSAGIEQVYKGEKTPTAEEQEFINGLNETEQKTLRDAATTGALDSFRRRVRLVVKERELEEKKKQLWGDPNNPEKIKGRQVPKTILKSLERFNKKMRKTVGMKIVLVSNPAQARIDYQVVDLFDEGTPNYEAEPGFNEYTGQPGIVKSLQRVRRRLVANELIAEFVELPWVKETLGMLVDDLIPTLNWRQYVAQVEEGKVTSQAPTNYIEVSTALELIRARRMQVESEMEMVGFKRKQTLAAFNRVYSRRL